MQVLETWERHFREYELLTKRRVPERDKIQTVRDTMPNDLSRDVAAMEMTG